MDNCKDCAMKDGALGAVAVLINRLRCGPKRYKKNRGADILNEVVTIIAAALTLPSSSEEAKPSKCPHGEELSHCYYFGQPKASEEAGERSCRYCGEVGGHNRNAKHPPKPEAPAEKKDNKKAAMELLKALDDEAGLVSDAGITYDHKEAVEVIEKFLTRLIPPAPRKEP